MQKIWIVLAVALWAPCALAQLRDPFLDPRYVDSEQVFDTSTLARIDITMSESDYDMDVNPGTVEYPANLQFQNALLNETINNVGVRFRGGTSIGLTKASWNVDFNEFVPGQQFHGLRQFNIISHHNDPSIFRGQLMRDFCRAQAIPAARSHLTDLYLHTTGPGAVPQRFLGTFVNTEQVDATFLRAWFTDNDGTLFKCIYPADFEVQGSGASGDYENSQYELQTNGALNDWSDLASFINVLNNTPGGSFASVFPQHMDVQTYLRQLAVETLFGHWDGHWHNTNNCYLYYIPDTAQPGTGVMQFITSDVDNVMEVNFVHPNPDAATVHANLFGVAGPNPPLPTRVLAVPAWASQYRQILSNWYAGPFTSAALDPEVIRYRDMIAPSILADVNGLDNYGAQWGFTYTTFLNSVNNSGNSWWFVHYGVFEYIAARSAQGVPAEMSLFAGD